MTVGQFIQPILDVELWKFIAWWCIVGAIGATARGFIAAWFGRKR